jgi:hypothetical protein
VCPTSPINRKTQQRNALAYFNFLNEEGRAVAAALLPIEGDAAA